MLFNAHVCNHILLQSGGGTWTQLCTLLEVWVLRVGMSTLGRKRLCLVPVMYYGVLSPIPNTLNRCIRLYSESIHHGQEGK